jgi:hypothetical protein
MLRYFAHKPSLLSQISPLHSPLLQFRRPIQLLYKFWRHIWGGGVPPHILNLARDRVEWTASLLGRFNRGRIPTHPPNSKLCRLQRRCVAVPAHSHALHATHNTAYRNWMHKRSKTKLDVCMLRKNYSMPTYSFVTIISESNADKILIFDGFNVLCF